MNKIQAKIAEYAASEEGADKTRIDTKKEYNSLWNYYKEHKEELQPSEKETILDVLDTAKQYLIKIKAWFVTEDMTVKDEMETKKPIEYDINPDLENPKDENPDPTKMTDKTPIEYEPLDLVNPKDENPDPTKMTDKTAIEYDINPDLVNPKDENPDPTKMTDKTDATDETETTGISDTKSTGTKAEGTKVYINGQLCIKMPNGEVYNAGTGQRIE